MFEEIPKIQSIEKISTLYRNYYDATRVTGSMSFSPRVIPVSELSGLDGLLENTDAYLRFANGLSVMRSDLRDFQGSMEETLEYVVKYVRGRFDGRSEAEINSVGSVLGLIPYGSSGESKGKVSGEVDLGVYDFEKLAIVVPSNHQWLKDFLTQYVAEINGVLELVEAGEPNVRLKVEIDRMNNAMKDCYQEENVTRLKFASQNTLGGLKHVREMMFPKYYDYPKTDCFAEEAKQYIDSLRALREFGEGKERVSFRFGDIHPKVGCFEDESPRPKGRGFWANLFVN